MKNKFKYLAPLFLLSQTGFTQTGYFFIGVDSGINSLSIQERDDSNWTGGTGGTTSSLSAINLFGDIAIGYNRRWDKFSLGITSRYSYLNNQVQSKTSGVFEERSYFENTAITLNHVFDILAQIGYNASDKTLLYVEAGPASGSFIGTQSFKFTTQPQPISKSRDKTQWGYDIGIGIKEQICDTIALNFAVNYLNLGTITRPDVHGNALDKIQYLPSAVLGRLGLEYRV